MFRFAHPLYLLLLLVIPLVLFIRLSKGKNPFKSVLSFSSIEFFKRIKASSSFWKKYTGLILLLLSYACFVTALARPQTMSDYVNIHSEGIDIVLVLDLSGSMSFVDGIPENIDQPEQRGTSRIYIDREGDVQNRLDIAKKILIEFIEKRRQDRIGLVVFSDYPYTESPVTISRDIIQQKVRNIDFSGTKGQSTAIGDAIVSAVNKLVHSKSKSKVVILTTDGNSNRGEDPIAMAQLASDEGIKVYCIGIGGKEEVLRPQEGLTNIERDWTVYEEVPMEDGERLDEKTLRKIASITGGKFFRGSDEEELRQIYNEIDTLEKSEADFENIYINYEEQFFPFMVAGLVLLIMAFLLKNTFLRILP